MARTITIFGGLFVLAFGAALFVMLYLKPDFLPAAEPPPPPPPPKELVGAEAVKALRWEGKIRPARVKEIVAWIKAEPNFAPYEAELAGMLQLPQENILERAYVVLEPFKMPREVGFNEVHTLIVLEEANLPTGDFGPLEVWVMTPHKCVGCKPPAPDATATATDTPAVTQ